MGIEFIGQRFLAGEAADLSLADLEHAFAGLVAAREPRAWQLALGQATDLNTRLSLGLADGRLTWFAVERPVEDMRQYEALLRILLVEGLVLMAPESPPVVGHPDTARHLPPDLIEGLGEAVLVTSARDVRLALIGR